MEANEGRWDLSALYNGFDDPAFEADIARLDGMMEAYRQQVRSLDGLDAAALADLLGIGETAEEKARGLADEVLRTQLKAGLYGLDAGGAERLWVAYEPVWAIGEHGVPATREYAGERHDTIRRTLTELYGEQAGQAVPLLYGGSVNPDNAVGLIRMENIDGLFIGRSAWDARKFNAIIRDVLAAADG